MSFQQGLSGLNASSKNLEIIGNNIANANTFGAKSARAEFSDMYSSSLNGAKGNQAGIGVNLRVVAQQFTQGAITTTSNTMDLAINGRGFFQLRNQANEINYTRNGQFKIDRQGYVVNNDGLYLLAQPWDKTTGRANGDADRLHLETALKAPVATGGGSGANTGVTLAMNLQADDEPATGTFSPNSPATYNYSTSQSIYDQQGAALSITYYFAKSATADTWDVYATLEGELPDPTDPLLTVSPIPFDGLGGTSLVGTLTFDANGELIPPSTPVVASDLDITFNPDIKDPRDPAGPTLFTGLPLRFSDFTQFAASYSVSQMSQDGSAAGSLLGIEFSDTGKVLATYSNGQSENLGVVQLANFTNLQGLQSLGGNLWASSYDAGDVTLSSPGEGIFGSLQPGALEESNVDLTSELVNMITAQRIYQANAQTIKAQDQVLQTLVNLR